MLATVLAAVEYGYRVIGLYHTRYREQIEAAGAERKPFVAVAALRTRTI